jgi:hypothetical protein
MNLRFQRGDIVISAPGWSAGCYCILDVDPGRPRYAYSGLNLVNNKRYSLTDDSLIKVGTATEDFLNGSSPTAAGKDPALDLRYQRGRVRAEREAWQSTGDTKKRWEILRAAKPGDVIKIQYERCGQIRELKFHYVIERGTRFVFAAESSDGRLCKYPLDDIEVDQQPEPLPFLGLSWEPRVLPAPRGNVE